MTPTAPPARLKTRYLEEIRPALIERFGYSSVMQAPKLEKITLNMGVGHAKQDSKMLKAATEQLATIAGQQPSVRRARKSIAAFKLREGMPVGVAVTLRGERGYEFLDRLVSIAIPRIRDFRGLNPRSFDGRGNYSLGVASRSSSPRSTTTRSTWCAALTSRSPPPPPPMSRPSRCCRRWACPSPPRAGPPASTPGRGDRGRGPRGGRGQPPPSLGRCRGRAPQPAAAAPEAEAAEAEAVARPRPPPRRSADAIAGRGRRRGRGRGRGSRRAEPAGRG